MQTNVVRAEKDRRYEIWADGELAGYTEYHPFKGALAFIHTEVDDRFQGKGLASTLVRDTLDEMRGRGEPVLPFCPFVRGYIGKHPRYVELVPEEDRATFGL